MHTSAGQLPYEPAVNSAEQQLPGLCLCACAGHIVKQPLDLGAGKVRVRDESCLMAYRVAPAIRDDPVYDIRGAPALPYYRVGYRLSGLLIPYYRSLALVCYAYGRNIRSLNSELCHCRARHLQRRVPYLHRVMLDPAGLREYLSELLLHGSADVAGPVEEYAAAACGPLIEGHYVFHLTDPFTSIFSFYIFGLRPIPTICLLYNTTATIFLQVAKPALTWIKHNPGKRRARLSAAPPPQVS